MKINYNGFWENNTNEGHGVDQGLAKALASFFLSLKSDDDKLSVIDIGCGNGYYTKFLRESSINCVGFDGNPFTPQLTDGLCGVADFSKEQYLGRRTWVLSLEVGEHIPEEFEDTFIDNLCNHARSGIILSWALPGQGGDGHVNCRSNEYIKNKLAQQGARYLSGATEYLRNSCSVFPLPCYWFRDTLMVFEFHEI